MGSAAEERDGGGLRGVVVAVRHVHWPLKRRQVQLCITVIDCDDTRAPAASASSKLKGGATTTPLAGAA